MSMLRPLFLSEATRSTHTPIAPLARLVGVKATALRCYRSQVLRGENSEKKVSEHVRTCVRTALTLDQAQLRQSCQLSLAQRLCSFQANGIFLHCKERCLRLAYARLGIKYKKVVA